MFLKLFNKSIDVKRINHLKTINLLSIQTKNFSKNLTTLAEPTTKKKRVIFKQPKYAEKPKGYKLISKKDMQNIPDKFREYFDSQQNVNFDSNSGFFGLKELASVDSLKEEHKRVLETLVELQKISTNEMSDQEFLHHTQQIHEIAEDIQFKCFLVKSYIPIVPFIQQANFVQESIEAFLYQQLDFQKIYKRLKSVKFDSSEDSHQQTQLLQKYEKKGFQFEQGEEGNFFEAIQHFGDSKQKFGDFLKSISEVQVLKPSSLYEVPSSLFRENVKRKKIKKKKYAAFDFESEMPTSILKNVRHEAKRMETYNLIRKKTIDSEAFISSLTNVVESANEIAKERNFKTFSDMILNDLGMEKQVVVDTLTQFEKEIKIAEYTDKVIKFAKETDSNINHLEPYNLLFFENAYLKSKKSYRDESIDEFFSISRCLESIETYCQKYFNITFKALNFDENESWNPKNLKKIQLFEGENMIGVLYLDVFKNDSKETNITGNSNLSIISTNFEKNILGLPTLLSHSQLRQLLKFIGHSIFNFKSKNSNILLKEIFGSVFEKISYQKEFLSSMKHFETNQKIFDEYVEDIISLPFISVFETYKQVLDASLELKIFEQNSYESLEDSNFEFLPNFKMLKNLGTNFIKIYSEFYSSQIWDQILKNKSSEIAALFECDSSNNILKKLIGSEKPNPEFLIKEIKKE
eukprot:gene6768-10932_t